MKKQILLLDGGGTQTLPIAKSLYKKGHSVHVFYVHKLSYGYATRYASHRVQSPSITNEAEFDEFLRHYVIKNGIDVVIPMSDPSAMFLSRNRDSLLQICKFIAPDYEVFMKGYDKNKLMTVCRDYGFPHPKTFDMSVTDIASIEDTFFPAILKPNLTTGGRGMKILAGRKELEEVYDSNVKQFGPCHLQEFIQEGGRQFKVELFLDENHRLINSSVIHKQRFYPVSGGSSCFNTTINDDSQVGTCYEVLKKIGWTGFADFDLIEDPKDGVKKIMEINPRIPACVKSAVDSGVDYASLIVDASLGREPEKYEYIPGKQLRHIGFDLLWFVHSKNRFRASPGWFNFFNKEQSLQDFSFADPMPFIYGTVGNIKKMSNADFRKAKNSTKI